MSAGPFDSEREIWAAMGYRPGYTAPPTTADNEAALRRACELAGVELGAYDERIVRWLSTFEATTCAVIAGLILRASDS